MRVPKIISLLILSLILIQSSIVLVFLQLRVHRMHQNNWGTGQNIAKISMFLTLEDFNRQKVNSHEIKVNGKLYDIKSISISDTGYNLVVISDDEESMTLDKIASFFSSNNKVDKSATVNSISVFFNFHFFDPLQQFTFYNFSTAVSVTYHYGLNWLSIVLKSIAPPPKI